MDQVTDPRDNPATDPQDKATEPAGTPAEAAWYAKLGFSDEATALESAQNAQRKISELGRENSEYRRTQTQSQGTSAQPQESPVTAESFFDNPDAAIARISESTSRKVLQEFQQKQQTERLINEAASKHGVDRGEIEDAYYALNNDPDRAIEYLAAIAQVRKGGVQASDIKAAIQQGDANKAAATGTTGGNHVPDTAEPDWANLSWEDSMKEMARLGMIDPQKGGFTVN